MAALALVTALAAVLRFEGLTRQALWLDEYLSAESARRTAASILARPDGEAPLHGLLIHGLTVLGLDGDWWLRAPSALAGVLAVPLLYVVARRLADQRVALVAAVLLAIHPFAIWQAQESRVYAPLMLCALASTWCLTGLMRRPGATGMVGYSLLATFGFGLHYYYLFVLAAHGVVALADVVRAPQRRLMWVGTAVLTVVAVAAWAPALLADAASQAQQDEGRAFSWVALPYTALAFVGGFSLGPPLRTLHPVARNGGDAWAVVAPYLPITVLAIAVLASLLLLAVVARGERRVPPVVLALVVIPVLGPWFASMMGVGFRPRYAAAALPFVLLASAWTLRGRWTRAAYALLATLAVLEAVATAQRDAPEYAREDTRAAAHYVAARVARPVTFLVGEGSEPYRRYARDGEDVRTVEREDVADAPHLAQLLGTLAGVSDVFVVSSRSWTVDPGGRVTARLDGERPLREGVDFPGVAVRWYTRPTVAEP